MNFTVPRKTDSEFLLYLWKIIDLPVISMNDLLYKISFELFLDSPKNTLEFINRVIAQKLLLKDKENHLKLSQSINKKFQNWQNTRKKALSSKIQSRKQSNKQVQNIFKPNASSFDVLLRVFADKSTINRTVGVPQDAFKLNKVDFDKNLIDVEVSGTADAPYYIKLDVNKKLLNHNCEDFINKRAPNKHFCKHIAKLFLMLKERNEASTSNIINEVARDIENWEFSK